jgi:hypothetical protein
LEGFARAAEGEEALGVKIREHEHEDVEGEVGDGADLVGHVDTREASRLLFFAFEIIVARLVGRRRYTLRK